MCSLAADCYPSARCFLVEKASGERLPGESQAVTTIGPLLNKPAVVATGRVAMWSPTC